MIQQLIGMKIVAIKGHIPERDKRKKPQNQRIPAEYILFDDGETYIELSEQDYYSYHDCSSFAREIHVLKDREEYYRLLSLRDATEDFGDTCRW